LGYLHADNDNSYKVKTRRKVVIEKINLPFCLEINMKKALFYISFIVSFILLINVGKILIFDFNRLTEYGFGYLAGKFIMLLLFLSVVYLTRKSVINEK